MYRNVYSICIQKYYSVVYILMIDPQFIEKTWNYHQFLFSNFHWFSNLGDR